MCTCAPGVPGSWSYTHAYAALHGQAPASNAIEILDAGCGTGVTAQYLSHLNPRATHFDALDLSSEALKVSPRACVS